ncbi:MAG TPA: caspase family protein [Allosphingosinicella sp.]|nr:caspase family protein [Allosphingosinicella sp.]
MCAAAKGYSLHVGLNFVDPAHYQGWDGELKACENDADDMQALAAGAGYETRKLLRAAATRQAFIDSLTAAAAAAEAGDIFLLTFSGHGGQLPNAAGGDIEPDGMDETLCLFDGQLVDDELELLWRRFRPGVRILMISDSCNSETVAKLAPPFPGGEAIADRPRIKSMPEAIKRRVYEAHRAAYTEIQLAAKAALDQRPGPAAYTVRLLAGCQDGTSSYDGPENGAFTAALLKAWNYGRFAGDYRRFHTEIVRVLREDQVPQLQHPQHNVFGTADSAFDAQQPFSIAGGSARQAARAAAQAARFSGSFTQANAERVIQAAAHDLTNVHVGLTETVSDRFGDASEMRMLLGRTQDLILQDFDIWVDLASGTDDDLEDLRGKTYLQVASWVFGQVSDSGQPSRRRWELAR